MDRRGFLVHSAVLSAALAGCTTSSVSSGPEATGTVVGTPEPTVLGAGSDGVEQLPDVPGVILSPSVRNDGLVGEVHVTLTLLEHSDDGVNTGMPDRLTAVELDTGEETTVEFEGIPGDEYNLYRVRALPNTVWVEVHNEGEPGRIEVSIVGGNGTVHDSSTVELASGEQRKLRFDGVYVQFSPEGLSATAEAVSQESGSGS